MAKAGHTDAIIIADAGLAVPNTTRVIDLSLAPQYAYGFTGVG